ncbi:MAG: fused DSP-PTPase phosphatase/NAD kinase-like protein, partial [Planctomycetota bacterium]
MRSLAAASLLLIAGCRQPEPAPATAQAPAIGSLFAPALGLLNEARPEPGLITSGQPTEAQFAALPAAGVTTVIHLRPTTEKGTGWEEAKARDLGLAFVRLPIDGAKAVTEANARKLADLLAGAKGPVLLSCGSSNRCGALLALKAFHVDGLGKDEALACGRRGGLKALEPTVAALLAKGRGGAPAAARLTPCAPPASRRRR